MMMIIKNVFDENQLWCVVFHKVTNPSQLCSYTMKNIENC